MSGSLDKAAPAPCDIRAENVAPETDDAENEVRRDVGQGVVCTIGRPPSSAPAHASGRLPILLNSKWRVVDDDLQYILQHLKGAARSKATGWLSRSFCRTRSALLRSIRENCGAIDESALGEVEALRQGGRFLGLAIRSRPVVEMDISKFDIDRFQPHGKERLRTIETDLLDQGIKLYPPPRLGNVLELSGGIISRVTSIYGCSPSKRRGISVTSRSDNRWALTSVKAA